MLVFPALIGQIPVPDHFTAFGYYLRSYDLTVSRDGRTLTGTHPDGTTVTAVFDDSKRLERLTTTRGGH